MKNFCLEVWGDFACFTRPEMKVERVSYDVITPSSARAMFEAILWKPAIRWHVHKIEVLEPIRWINVRRNEVGAVISERNIKTAMNTGKGSLGLYVDDPKVRQQRAGLFLRDVKYRIHAGFEMTERAGAGDTPVKFAEMFERRAAKGQCFNQPYLGCREFAAGFRLVDAKEKLAHPISESRDLGWMLFDMDYSDTKDPKPLFFRAEMKDGVVDVPAFDSEEVRG
ncbi:MAG: type I-C CRISPR-associated protein Cas5 [Zetaproteobacteria bacterium CG06_land_8_20_14_3_00_59_53]|nr:MAG: type I-C CRISPR-associated protein Cas5 [Zetaproteobacteria bacterium CG2_30_59_37]PIO90322.1 MAG: type I-C CRISPR-associated protein Cas5 [Zetaproteobacteria bacterium CG23_combo_of_CG06-09_8_20_14_all_59_86]PIQ65891.1 MAG: type I-C CRISPR-associated protein Cas5 [Zetaproteobacteria bacterium CG11_big_fil_rev_8_21_14_0_20_59_439]PIU70523.1 MAG: type I-C CRISPR-associated protein Cas5 [Zetaproteobacteria bacterium CG06_land_8_20_14_3_00_59_53]PIU97619.1 MAG: type I-C CRISPR-associated p